MLLLTKITIKVSCGKRPLQGDRCRKERGITVRTDFEVTNEFSNNREP